ncbi:hypothetical protein KCU81_g1530, partial [Aureobasidium melanogenum]|uniref:Uncharacterized protein n=1 Tax=Aureobasidium melanogenum (strain CBS 110374) TaxID=1043003 RepID=A0A074WV29_AURM1
MARNSTNKPISTSDAQKIYAQYAKNIDIRFLQVNFSGSVGQPMDVHGDKKSVKSGKHNITCHSVSMRTSDGKNKVWVYRGAGTKYVQDIFEVPEGTEEETLKIMLERATGLDANGNKVEIK